MLGIMLVFALVLDSVVSLEVGVRERSRRGGGDGVRVWERIGSRSRPGRI